MPIDPARHREEQQLKREGGGRHWPIVGARNLRARTRLRPDPVFGHDGKKDSGYHQQARMENAFFRYKLIIGESLRARSRAGQETEAILACNILNQMTQRGRPASYAIGR